MTTDLTAGFIIWIVTTQCVNFAFYLAITQLTYGWARTLGAYLVYILTLAVAFSLLPFAHGGIHGAAGELALSFIAFFTLWGVLGLMMSRGQFGRRLFAVFLCGIHQLVAFVFCLLILRRVESQVLGPLLSSCLMALMGVFVIIWARPRVERMPEKSGWGYLNVMAGSLFLLMYTSGFYPVYVPTESPDHIAVFLVSALVTLGFFVTSLAFAERSRLAASLATVEDNLRLMANEMADRHEVIAVARQIWNDRLSRRDALCDFLREGRTAEALAYLENLNEEGEGRLLETSVWCENETINAILSGYSRKAAAAGLRFSAMASIPAQGGLPEVEIVELVSNLLEISLRTSAAKGNVTCLLRQRAGSFGVTVTNTPPPDFVLSPEGFPTTGPDVNLDRVRDIVRKYHGDCRYNLAGDVLSAQVILSVN